MSITRTLTTSAVFGTLVGTLYGIWAYVIAPAIINIPFIQ